MTEETPNIPSPIQEMMQDDEIENMRNLDGWSYVVVAHVEDGEVTEEFEAWAELFDGRGRAGQFDGIRFMAAEEKFMEDAEDGPFDHPVPEEAYAYSNKELFEESGKENAYYVKEYKNGREVTR